MFGDTVLELKGSEGHDSSVEKNEEETASKKISEDVKNTSENVSPQTAENVSTPLFSVGMTGEAEVKALEEEVLVSFQGIETKVPRSEFPVLPEVGSKIEVVVTAYDSTKGVLKVSHQQVEENKKWDAFFSTHQVHQTVSATSLRPIRGGFLVDIGVSAFLPSSLAGFSKKEGVPENFSGPFHVEILELTPEKKNVVVSRKSVLNEERKKTVEDFLKSLEVGSICEGEIQDITDFGAFIRIGAVDGLLHIKDMSWEHLNHPSELLQTHQKIKVKILKVDLKNEKVSLGLKQVTDVLWETAEKEFAIHREVTGKVVSLKPFGAFVRLKEGLEGLLHISQISRKKIEHPSEVLSIGQEVKAIVLSVNQTQKRIALGMKQLEADPWADVPRRYVLGKSYKGTVTGIVSFGAFVQLEEGIEGLIHISKLSQNRIESPSEVVKLGEEVTVTILEVKPEEKRIRLSLVE